MQMLDLQDLETCVLQPDDCLINHVFLRKEIDDSGCVDLSLCIRQGDAADGKKRSLCVDQVGMVGWLLVFLLPDERSERDALFSDAVMKLHLLLCEHKNSVI